MIPSELNAATIGLLVFTVIAAVFLWKFLKKFFSKFIVLVGNSIAGVLMLVGLNLLLGLGIPINIFTLIIAGIFGVPGIACLILLKIGGMI